MNNQTIQIPAEVDSVTLHIQKDNTRTEYATLRQALLSTQGSRPVYVRVKERNGLEWEVYLGPINVAERDEGDTLARVKRIERFSSCGLCDAATLLDERVVKKVDLREAFVHMNGGTGISYSGVVYEVDADVQ